MLAQFSVFQFFNLAMSAMKKLEETSISSSLSSLELDPLLNDLTEKKLSFKRNVVSLVAELKDVRIQLALQEKSIAEETHSRKVADKKAMSMEEEVSRLQKCLQEKDEKLHATSSAREQYLEKLDELRSQLSITRPMAEDSAVSAQSAQVQSLNLLRELNEKNSSIADHEIRVNKLVEQLDHLQKELQARELSQRQLRDEVTRTEKEIMQAIEVAGANQDCELMKILAEVSPKDIDNINKLLVAVDDEINRLRDDLRILSANWKYKTEEHESQLEKHQRIDQELKKRVMKLEFCLQEARSQMRKLHKREEKRDRDLKELRDQLAKKHSCAGCMDKQNFLQSRTFKIIASMSMLVLVLVSKRLLFARDRA